MSSLPANVRPYLKLQLDSDNKWDKDLIEIASHMSHWDGSLSSFLGLTPVDINDIKKINPNKPVLQRSACQLHTWLHGLRLFVQTGCSSEMEEQAEATA